MMRNNYIDIEKVIIDPTIIIIEEIKIITAKKIY